MHCNEYKNPPVYIGLSIKVKNKHKVLPMVMQHVWWDDKSDNNLQWHEEETLLNQFRRRQLIEQLI